MPKARRAAHELIETGNKLGWCAREESDATVEFQNIERLDS